MFLVFAIIAIFGIYQFGRGRTWEIPSAIGAGSLKQYGLGPLPTTSIPRAAPEPAKETVKVDEKLVSNTVKEQPLVVPAPIAQEADTVVQSSKQAAKASTSSKAAGVSEQTDGNKQNAVYEHHTGSQVPYDDAEVLDVGAGRLEVTSRPALSVIHWTKLPEHFPVTSTIPLPTGSPKPIPRIQYKFGPETADGKRERIPKQKAIRDAAIHAWKGYKDHAWMSDEVSPVSGGKRNPFCGWAASLVDALDTLWIMDLKEEFEEATQAVAKIDFTTSPRKDIPLFETTIRYLGGLLAAYDLSGGKYRILLDKAVELAEILMGAFDTPNRMPMTYYHWLPTFASQPHRATTRVVLAEIGSLSVEFTRLAQLTKEPKYYDAIARITDAFEEWQDREVNGTLVPGMWPIYLDASGCEKPAQIQTSHSMSKGPMPPPLMGPPSLVGDGIPSVAGEAVRNERKKPAPGKATTDKQAVTDLSSSKEDAYDEPLHLGRAGKAKIAHWGDPLDEGALDDKAQRESLLHGARPDSSFKKDAYDEPLQLGRAGKAKIAHWGDPLDEGALDDKSQRESLLHGAEPDSTNRKRQLGGLSDETSEEEIQQEVKDKAAELAKSKDAAVTAASKGNEEVCIPRGLDSPTTYGSEKFTLGAMSDSMYEYLPKQYLLLGGLEEKYRTMYEKSIKAATEYLLYRPMTPDNLDILMSGEWRAYHEPESDGSTGSLVAEGAHLTCFAGGMYAMGAKIFDRKGDLEIGAKLTEGCVWAYNSTTTGIMPETFLALPCDEIRDCKWNETKYWDALDPFAATRTKVPDLKLTPAAHAQGPAKTAKAVSDEYLQVSKEHVDVLDADTAKAVLSGGALGSHKKRQIDSEPAERPLEAGSPVQDSADPATRATPIAAPTYKQPTPMPHEEYVQKKIQDERLPPGFVKITSKKYILR